MIEPRNPAELAIDPSKLQDDILGLLEDAGIDTATNDAIMKLVEAGEMMRAEAMDITEMLRDRNYTSLKLCTEAADLIDRLRTRGVRHRQ